MKEHFITDTELIASLLFKQLQGSLTDAEALSLNEWQSNYPASKMLLETIENEGDLTNEIQAFHPDNWAATNARIKAIVAETREQTETTNQPEPIPVMERMRWGWVAAAIFCCIATGAYFHLQSTRENALVTNATHINTDIEPGREGAILTLEDGTQLILDSLNSGLIATQNGSQLLLQSGQLAYDPTGKTSDKLEYNTMTTPKGRQFNLQLPDGTKVWLNAASTMRYPTQFYGAERRVEITGEAYFEVAQKSKQPFIVKIRGQDEVEVLGTSFNVQAYTDENTINTTLIEGAVKLRDVVLKPGQQAQLPAEASNADQQVPSSGNNTPAPPVITTLNESELEKVMAWKNGVFNFQNASLEEVMRQLARWYDLEVVYGKNIPVIAFGGKISRNVKLASVLQALEDAKIYFRIEGNRKLVLIPAPN